VTRTFLSHLYKSFARSSSVGRDTALQIALGVIALALIGYSLALGIALERIITITLNEADPVTFLNGLLVYYLIGEFITRYFLQSLPALQAQPYLHLPVPRSKIANFLVGRSLVHVINVFVFLLFTPFAFGPVAKAYGIGQAWAWLLSIWFLSLINHFALILLGRKVGQNPWTIFAFFFVSAFLASADHFGLLQLSDASQRLFGMALQDYSVAGILFLSVALFYYLVYRSFVNKLYMEDLSVRENQGFHLRKCEFLQRFGLGGAWANLELKLILRNKRSRELLIMHGVFLLLPLGFYTNAKNPEAYGTFLFFAVVSSGFFTMNYGQFLFGWQGAHFDFTLVQPTSIRQFVESKYWLLASFVVVWFFLSIPYVFLGWRFLLINLAGALYNVGINSFVVMNMSMWGVKKVDLKHPGALNLQGIGAAQWLMGFPLIAGVYVIYIPFSLMGYPISGLVAVGLTGLVGMVLRDVTIDFTARRLFDKRHLMASNFRKDE